MNSTTATNAILLVIAGTVAAMANHVMDVPLYGLISLASFVLVVAICVGEVIAAFKNAQDGREPKPRKTRNVDPYADVPANVDTAKRLRDTARMHL